MNAYIHQVLGFEQVAALKQGIVAYERWADERGESKFIGKNFIFDRRRLVHEEKEDC